MPGAQSREARDPAWAGDFLRSHLNLLHRKPAIYRNRLAGDPGAAVGTKENDHAGHISYLPEAFDGIHLQPLLFQIRGKESSHRRVNESWGNGIDGNIVAA